MNGSPQCTYVRRISIFFALTLFVFLLKPAANAAKNESANASRSSKQRVAEAYGKLPLSFEANTGQTNREVRFLSRGPGYTLFLTRNAEAVLVLNASLSPVTSGQLGRISGVKVRSNPESKPSSVIRTQLVNADLAPQAAGQDELPGRANYFIGDDPRNWRTNVPLFSRVQYRNVYPGVDLAYYGNQQQLEYDFIVAPGADPRSIMLSFDGAEELSLDAQGNLVLATKESKVRLEKPRIYQDAGGTRREIRGDYLLKHAHEVGFQVAAYDPTKPLVIDPVLSYSTYLGGGGNNAGGDSAAGIVVDSAGNAYIIGTTGSPDFPTTPGAFQTTGPAPCSSNLGCAQSLDVFVTKLNPQGSALVYSSFLGGTYLNYGSGIAVDSSGNAYVTGRTCSSDFPTTAGAFQTMFRGDVTRGVANAFIAKVDPTGSSLVYSTYLGGTGGAKSNVGGTCYLGDQGTSIAVDPNGDAYVTGGTQSIDFPTTSGSFEPAYHSTYQGSNAFITKLNPTGTSLLYSTYLGGSNYDAAYGLAVDQGGHAYLTGRASSPDFPTTPGAFQTASPLKVNTFGGGLSAFVTEMSTDGTALLYSTYVGGNGEDIGLGIAVDSAGSAYITGYTTSIDFPTTPGAFQPVAPIKTASFATSAFVTKLNNTGSGLTYSTYVGGIGGGTDAAYSIAVDSVGDAFLTGYTTSIDFPITANAIQPVPADAGNGDAFVLALNPQGSAPVYSSYLGGIGGSSFGAGVALDSSFNVYVVGATASTAFLTTPGAFQSTAPQKRLSFEEAAFVTKISGIL